MSLPRVLALARHARPWAVAWALVTVGALWMALGTIERGNRLFRSGEPERAAALYGEVADRSDPIGRAGYNAGTALLALGSEAAPGILERTAASARPDVARLAHYNLAYGFLVEADPEADPFTATLLLSSAIEHGRAALRLDPEDENVRWNLALALRAYAELAQVVEEAPAEAGAGEVAAPEDPLESPRAAGGVGGASEEAEGAPPPTEPGEPTGSRSGAQQTAASGDPGPLSENAAFELLAQESDDTSTLIRGLLWSQRPAQEVTGESPGSRW